VPPAVIAHRFHNTLAQIIAEMCRQIASDTGLDRVALSGGCFQNRLLLSKTVHALREGGFEVLTHQEVPCNDGGVSLGQATIAHFTHKLQS
jgi:hydrogenase maturation protein HypF